MSKHRPMERWADIRLENNIPIPPRQAIAGTLAQIIGGMKIGQSFLATQARAQYAHQVAQCLGITVVTRKVNGEGVRVWRVSPEDKCKLNTGILRRKQCERTVNSDRTKSNNQKLIGAAQPSENARVT